MSLKKFLGLGLISLLVLNCTEETPKLLPLVPEEKEKTSVVAPVGKDSFRPQLDILFVIDDSGSMGTHQKKLKDNFDKFADAIVRTKFLDYHVGVITSSSTGGPWSSTPSCCGELFGIPRFIDRNTPNGISLLAQNMIVGTSGDATETFFDPLYLALTDPNLTGYNKDFYREDASLAIIFITDTEDQSRRFNAQTFYGFLLNLKKTADKIFVAGAHIPDNQVKTCSGETFEIERLDELNKFFALTQASTFSLCDDFGEKLADIGIKIATKSQTMFLSKKPKKGTIKVSMDGVVLPSDSVAGWTYNASNNSIEFGPGIDWDAYPEGVYPQVDFEVDVQKPEGE